jgi:predicted hydrocarbon binding protein
MSTRNRRKWLLDLLQEVEDTISREKLSRILESRGQACLPEAMLKKAKKAAKGVRSDSEFLDNLEQVYPMLERDGEDVYVVYPECYCPGMKELIKDAPAYYCDCSVGWVREMFEQALKRPVEVRLESSVIRGDPECRLRVML